MINRKAFITGIKSTYLSKKEIIFLKNHKPWGVILFSRNVKGFEQIKKLIKDIRFIFKDKKYPILIDQEGGRVNRLNKLIETSILTPEFFGNLYKKNKKKFFFYYKIYINQISYLLNEIGVNINTVPVLDVRRAKSSNVIGDRSYSSLPKNLNEIGVNINTVPVLDVRRAKSSNVIGDRSYSSLPKNVSKIGDVCIQEFKKRGIGTVIKHIPGHGLTDVDSHKLTPVVKKKMKFLYKNDFAPFKNKKTFFAMTAHVIFKDIDPVNTATHSTKIIKLIRKKIGFKNIIISDDISMKGLKYSIKQNLHKALSAGCNLILHCNANYSEMRTVAENSPMVDNFIIQKTSQFYKFLS